MSRPLYLDRYFPELLPARVPGKAPGRPPKDADPEAKLSTSIWSVYTFDQNNPTSYALNSSVAFNKGNNWSVWKDAVLSRGADPSDIVETGSTVTFNGDAVIELMSLPSRSMLTHSPPVEHINDMRSRSTVGTKFGFGFFNMESINQGTDWRTILDALRFGKDGAILGPAGTSGCWSNGDNGYLQEIIDKFEELNRIGAACSGTWPPDVLGTPPTDAESFTKHSWELDPTAEVDHPVTFVAGPYLDVLSDMFARYLFAAGYTTRIDPQSSSDVLIDWFIWDNVLDRPFKGSATNDFHATYTASVYTALWRTFLGVLQTLFPLLTFPRMIWGNSSPLTSDYAETDLQGRFVEFWQRNGDGTMKTLAELQAELDNVQSSGVHINTSLFDGDFGDSRVLQWLTSGGPGEISGTDYGTWTDVLAYAVSIGCEDQIVVDCGRATTGGYLFWDPSFVDPRDGV